MTIAQRHGGQFLVLPPRKVVVEEARLIEEFLLIQSPEHDHRADLDQIAGHEIPAGEYSTATTIRRRDIDKIGREDGLVRIRTPPSSTINHGIVASPYV